jgi:hypothetical protein
MIMYKDWEGVAGGSITVQVLGFFTLIAGIFILTVTRDAAPGCTDGTRAVMRSLLCGRSRKPQYELCDVDEKDIP